ncbi:MAG: Crp/Fnr family transcriptional regulator [Crocinitomicaceae bacterium]|nr:Crp/Fnr family transcriptional regulator [Crocinitomicaceae bacterium]
MSETGYIEELKSLFDFIELKVKLYESDKKLICSYVTKEFIKKGHEIVRLNQTCESLKFVVSGIYRVYKLEEGKEITSYFNYESRNPFVASFVSLLTKSPSNEIVECIKGGELLTIKYSDWLKLYKQSERLNTFGRIMAEFNYVLAMERIEALQYHNATERYESFLKLYPNLMNMIPHHYIASYIGVAPESLSRIRKELTKK